MHTVAFTKKMNNDNYPQLAISGADIKEDDGIAILQSVYEKKPNLMKKRIAEEDDVNDWQWQRKARKTTENQSTMHTPSPAAEDEIHKILPEILQLMKSHSAEDFKTIKDHLESP